MAKIKWGEAGTRFFEAGLDQGVFFLGVSAGVPWNGLISVDETSLGGETRPFYQDGFKMLNLAGAEEFGATVQSFYPPVGFAACDGTLAISNGLYATQQPRAPFSFSYRTRIGNDIDGIDLGYKIHIVYNALAASSDRSRSTITESAEPQPFSWEITTLPPIVTGFKPTAHFEIDSRTSDPEALAEFEGILYGTVEENSRLPSVVEMISIFGG